MLRSIEQTRTAIHWFVDGSGSPAPALRLRPTCGGCSSLRYARVLKYLAVDLVQGLGGVFSFENPGATTRRSCGKSFTA